MISVVLIVVCRLHRPLLFLSQHLLHNFLLSRPEEKLCRLLLCLLNYNSFNEYLDNFSKMLKQNLRSQKRNKNLLVHDIGSDILKDIFFSLRLHSVSHLHVLLLWRLENIISFFFIFLLISFLVFKLRWILCLIHLYVCLYVICNLKVRKRKKTLKTLAIHNSMELPLLFCCMPFAITINQSNDQSN